MDLRSFGTHANNNKEPLGYLMRDTDLLGPIRTHYDFKCKALWEPNETKRVVQT